MLPKQKGAYSPHSLLKLLFKVTDLGIEFRGIRAEAWVLNHSWFAKYWYCNSGAGLTERKNYQSFGNLEKMLGKINCFGSVIILP
jgi:hypothetical protein